MQILLNKILDEIRIFKKSIQRIEFSIEEKLEKDNQGNLTKKSKITSIENSLSNFCEQITQCEVFPTINSTRNINIATIYITK